MNLTVNNSSSQKVNIAELSQKSKDTGRIICVENRLYIKDDNRIFQSVPDLKAICKVRGIFNDPKLTHDTASAIIKNLKTDPDINVSSSELLHERYIRLKDGVWDIENKRMMKVFSNDMKFIRFVDADLSRIPSGESEALLKFCRNVFGEDKFQEKMAVLYELIGYCISDIQGVKQAVFLIGPPDCGKSVILELIRRLVGKENASSVSLANFGGKFNTYSMYNKVLNICGEIPSGTMPGAALDMFKSITGRDQIELEQKGQQPFQTVLNVKLIFAGNTLPTFSNRDGTNSLIQRMHLLIFDKSVNEKNIDKHILDKLWDERDKIVYYSLLALSKFVKNDMNFITTDDEKKMLDSLRIMANPFEHFVKSQLEFGKDHYAYITDVYNAYNEFAAEEALPDIRRTEFRKSMLMLNGVSLSGKKRLDGKSNKACYKGVRVKKLYDNRQDTCLYDEEVQ